MELDEFIVRHTLHSLQQQTDKNLSEAKAYFDSNDKALTVVDERLDDLEESESATAILIRGMQTMMDSLQKRLDEVTNELNKTKLINIKQELVVRTIHNKDAFEGNDMFADTFATGDKIDWKNSIRGEHLEAFQAVGKTRKALTEINQDRYTSRLQISQNTTSDEALSQSFIINKTKELDRVSIYLETVSAATWQPLIVRIRNGLKGSILAEMHLDPNAFTDGWVDVDMPNLILQANQEYYLEMATEDVYGYRIAVDTSDRYIAGTSYSLFESVWTDNNYDIAFKIWCFPSNDENNATLLTVPKVYPTMPTHILFDKEDTIINGSINYFVSRDAGATWKLLQHGISTDLSDIGEGKTVIIKAYIEGDSRIEAWGYVITRSDT